MCLAEEQESRERAKRLGQEQIYAIYFEGRNDRSWHWIEESEGEKGIEDDHDPMSPAG